MKKKLALLLVLSMILSMIPMNVFGENVIGYVPKGPTTVQMGTGANYSSRVYLKSSAFYPDAVVSTTQAAVVIEVSSEWGGASVVNMNGVANCGVVQATAGSALATEFGLTKTSWVVIFDPGKAGTGNTSDDAAFDITFNYPNWEETNVSAKIIALSTTSRFGSDTVVIGAPANKAWSIAAGSSVSFSDVATLKTITISDNVPGQFQGAHTMEFILPVGFTWYQGWNSTTSDANSFQNALDASNNKKYLDTNRFMPLNGTSNNATVGDVSTLDPNYKTGNGNRVLTVNVNAGPATTQNGALYLKNLEIVANEKAKYGTVAVDVYDNTLTTNSKLKATLEPASFSDYALKLTPGKVENYEVLSGEYGVETAKFTLAEVSPNSFPTSRTSTLAAQFTAPEGVKFTDAKVKMTGNDDSTVIPEKWYSVGSPVDDKGVRLTADSLYVSPYMNRLAHNNVLYTVEVTLVVSVEAGREAKYEDGDIITVTFGGAAMENVKIVDANNKTVAKEVDIASVVDQITVDVETKGIEMANAGQYAAYEAVNDIVITETEEGMLEQNSEIWVYIESARVFDLAFTSGTPYADGESGLKISKATKMNIDELPVGIKFEITRESSNGPGTITIPNGLISGLVYPGVEYKVIVSGPAIAASNEVVDFFENGTGKLGDWVKANPALFETAYSADLFTYAGGTIQNPLTPPVGGTDTETPADEVGLSMSIATPFVDTANGRVYNPFIIPTDGPGANSGYVAASVFAEMIGGSVEWNSPFATVTDGEVTVVIEKDAVTALVDGVEVGIYSGSSPSIPALFFNDRAYLPAKFVADMFGLNVDWNTATGMVTFS